MVDHHQPMSNDILDCCVQGQGHNNGYKFQLMIFLPINFWMAEPLQPNLVCCYLQCQCHMAIKNNCLRPACRYSSSVVSDSTGNNSNFTLHSILTDSTSVTTYTSLHSHWLNKRYNKHTLRSILTDSTSVTTNIHFAPFSLTQQVLQQTYTSFQLTQQVLQQTHTSLHSDWLNKCCNKHFKPLSLTQQVLKQTHSILTDSTSVTTNTSKHTDSTIVTTNTLDPIVTD